MHEQFACILSFDLSLLLTILLDACQFWIRPYLSIPYGTSKSYTFNFERNLATCMEINIPGQC